MIVYIQGMSAPDKFQSAAAVLLREAFEGIPQGQKYTWFVEKREGIFDALESLDAEAASRKPAPQLSSAAGHAYHMLYALRWANTPQGRPRPEGDWESTWARQSVSREEWADVQANIRSEYELFIAWFDSNTDWERENSEISALGSLPHLAYHLGALRQIVVAAH